MGAAKEIGKRPEGEASRSKEKRANPSGSPKLFARLARAKVKPA